MIRVPDLLVSLAVLWVGAAVIWRRSKLNGRAAWRESLVPAAVGSLAAGLAFLPQMIVWKVLYGKTLSMPPNPYYSNMSWIEPDLLNYLFSGYHSLLSWTPILLPATVGLIWGALKGPMILRWSLAVLVPAVYFNSSIHMWWAGASFGERRMVDYSVFFVLGLGYLLARRPSLWPRTTLSVVVCLCAFNCVLMVRYFTHDLPEYGCVSWYDLYGRTLDFPLRVLETIVGQ